ncbi:MATE family efflux transporter [Rhodobacteraceae bacterium]|nr:MATE family efflux transporter [Paracoccaceae bacterium]
MSWGGHTRAILVLGLPLIGSNIAQAALGVTDTIMLGWYGVPELAAVVLGTNYLFFFFLFGTGFANAVIGRVSMALGANDDTQARRDTRMALWLSLLFGVICLPALWFSAPALLALGQPPELAQMAQDYLRIAGFGILPMLVIAVLRGYLSAQERTQMVLWVTLGSVALNAALNWVLIFGNLGFARMGVEGAALASLIVQLAGAVLLVIYATRARGLREVNLLQRFWRPDWSAFFAVAQMGLPIGMTIMAEASMFQLATIMVGWLGTVPLAAHGIVMEISVLAFMFHMGLANAATVRAGRAHGARDSLRLKRGGIVVTLMALVIVAVTLVVFLTIPEQLISLFLNTSEPEAATIILLGAGILAVSGLFQLFDSLQVIAMGLLRGVQDTRVPMWIALASYWLIGMPSGYGLGVIGPFGAVGVWLGLAIGLGAASVMLSWRFWRRNWIMESVS